MEIVDGTTATILSVTDDNTFTIDLDTSALSQYSLDIRLHLGMEGVNDAHIFLDSSPQQRVVSVVGDAKTIDYFSAVGNSSGYFDGSDYLTVPDHTDWGLCENDTDDWTIHGFHRTNAIGTFSYVSHSDDANNYWTIHRTVARTLKFLLNIAGVEKINLETTIKMGLNAFVHWALVKKGDEYGLYIDGVLGAYVQTTENGNFSGLLYIGLGVGYVYGWLDEVMIIKGNYFNASPDAGLTDTITVPTGGYTPPTVEEYAPRFACNDTVDIAGDPWSAALKVLEQCRAVPYWKGSKISVAIDRAASPVYMFGPGNCIEGSLRHKNIPTLERATEIEAHFMDRAYDYQRRPISDINTSIGNPANKVRMDFFGVTDEYIVKSLTTHRLLKNQYEKKIINKRVEVDAIGVTIGDVVYHQDNLANWGRIGELSQDYTGGGRLLQATNGPNAEVTINGRIVFLDADFEGGATTYELQVKLSDDTIETKTITGHDASSVNAHKITVSGTFTICPREGDIWAAGRQNLVSKKFSVVDMQLNSLLQTDIVLSEYRDEVYAND